MKKRIVASLLSLCMVLTLLPVTVFAQDPEPTTVSPVAEDFTVTGNKASFTYGETINLSIAVADSSHLTGTVELLYGDSKTVPSAVGNYILHAVYTPGTAEQLAGGAQTISVNVGTLKIVQAGLAISTAEVNEKVYDGSGEATVKSITFSGGSPAANTDYTVNAEYHNVDVGENKDATIIVTLTETGKSKYILEIPTATVKGKITKATQAIEVDKDAVSMGTTQKAEVVVSKVLSSNVTCTSANDAVAAAAATKNEDGTWKVTVTSKNTAGTVNITVTAVDDGNCTESSKTVAVTVTDLPKAAVAFSDPTTTVTYGDANITNAATAKYGESDTPITAIKYTSSKPEVATVNASTGEVTIKGAGKTDITATVENLADTYVGASASYTLTVNPKKIEGNNYKINGKQDLKYTGTALEGVESITTTNGSETITLKAGTDYTITYSDNVNAGEAHARIIFEGNYTGDVVYSFSIAKATNVTKTLSKTIISSKMTVDLSEAISGVTFTAGDATVSGTNAAKFSASVNGTTLTMSKKAEDTELVNNDTATVEVPFTSANYGEGCKVTVTVTYSDKANLPSVSPTSVSLKVAGAGTTVTDAEKKATVTVTTDGTVTGATSANASIATVTSEGKIVTITGVAKGTTTVTITTGVGTEYAAGSITVSVTVTEKTSSGGGGGGSTGGGSYGGGGGGTGGTTSDPTTSGGTTSSTVTTTTSGSNATASVSSTTANKLVGQAVENKSDNVTVKVEAGSNVNSVTTQIPASAVDTLAKGSSASLTVDTPVADVVIPNSTLATLGSTSGTVTVKAAVASDKSLTVSVQKNGQDVGALPAPIKVSTPVSETGSGVVAVLVNADGTETVLPKSTLANGEMSLLLETGSATVKFENRAKDFTDVDGHWASSAIDFVSSHGLFQGVTTTTFGASTDTSRAMMVTVLHRLESEPTASGVSFDDVPAGSYYAEAAAWAADLGITQGNGNGFDGDADISREMMVTMLYRYVQKTAPGAGSMGSYAGMTGASQVSGWAAEAMNWAVGSGLIQGDAKGLRPGDSTSRAEMAAVMERFVGLLTK